MKIYELPVPDSLRPKTQGFIWPPDCRDEGVEQDFHRYLHQNEDLLVDDPDRADLHFLPIYWNRRYLTTPDGTRHGRDWGVELCILDRIRTFTVAEYDPRGLQPDVDLSGITVLTANRMKSGGIDIPLLVHAHDLAWPPPEKRWLACFLGNLETHEIRGPMWQEFRGHSDCLVEAAAEPIGVFVRVLQESYVALAPRGDGGQSFRFYEAMQAGTVPVLIGDLDTRPFPSAIDWEACSFWVTDPRGLYDVLAGMDRDKLLRMGRKAQAVWYADLRYGCWCKHAMEALEHARP